MKFSSRTFIRAVALGLLCTAPSCLYYPGSETGEGPSIRYRHAEQQYLEWCDQLPQYIIPRVCAYYQLHPERFRPSGQGEEIEIKGFAAFVKDDGYFKEGHLASVASGKINDPWGEPLRFVEDLNMDGYIEAGGTRRNVMHEGVRGDVAFTNGEHHFGILKRSPFKGPYGKPWERIFAVTYSDDRVHK